MRIRQRKFLNISGEVNYFAGGFITQTYGSREGGLTDALQLETAVREEPDVEMARGIAMAIVDYYQLYFNPEV